MAGHLPTASGRSLSNFYRVTPDPPIKEGRPARIAPEAFESDRICNVVNGD